MHCHLPRCRAQPGNTSTLQQPGAARQKLGCRRSARITTLYLLLNPACYSSSWPRWRPARSPPKKGSVGSVCPPPSIRKSINSGFVNDSWPDRVIRTRPVAASLVSWEPVSKGGKGENKRNSGRRNEQNKQRRAKEKQTNGREAKGGQTTGQKGIKELPQTSEARLPAGDPLWTKGGSVCSCGGVTVSTLATNSSNLEGSMHSSLVCQFVTAKGHIVQLYMQIAEQRHI